MCALQAAPRHPTTFRSPSLLAFRASTPRLGRLQAGRPRPDAIGLDALRLHAGRVPVVLNTGLRSCPSMEPVFKTCTAILAKPCHKLPLAIQTLAVGCPIDTLKCLNWRAPLRNKVKFTASYNLPASGSKLEVRKTGRGRSSIMRASQPAVFGRSGLHCQTPKSQFQVPALPRRAAIPFLETAQASPHLPDPAGSGKRETPASDLAVDGEHLNRAGKAPDLALAGLGPARAERPGRRLRVAAGPFRWPHAATTGQAGYPADRAGALALPPVGTCPGSSPPVGCVSIHAKIQHATRDSLNRNFVGSLSCSSCTAADAPTSTQVALTSRVVGC
jgi:hypothetical protein